MSVVSVVSERRSLVAEGPFWDAQQQKLLHVDVDGNALCRLDTKTHQTDALKFGGYVSFVIPYKNDPNKVVFSVGEDIKKLSCWTVNTMATLASAEKGPSPTRLNDGKCDAVGRLWTGTMALESAPAVLEPERGALYSLGKGAGLRKHVEKISISNGIAWTSDNKIMFYIDSYERKVYAFDFELQKGNICNQRVLVDFNTTPGYSDCGYPDGMTTDTNNHLWVACYDAGRIVKIDTATGKLMGFQEITRSLVDATKIWF